MIKINWKKTILVTMDLLLGVYLVLAVTAFNKPDNSRQICTQVKIDITDSQVAGFLNTDEIKKMLKHKKLYPLGKPAASIDCRKMEEALAASPFVDKVQCYKTQNGNISISLTQRMPVIRIMAENGSNYYLDNHGGIMGKTKYTADIIIATGKISQKFAQTQLSKVANYIVHSELWNHQIEQINVLDDGTMELVPRVGEHIIYIGDATEIEQKFDRLEKFYRYGLSKVGWNKYKYISVEFSNQIICKRNDSDGQTQPTQAEQAASHEEQTAGNTQTTAIEEKQQNNKKTTKTT